MDELKLIATQMVCTPFRAVSENPYVPLAGLICTRSDVPRKLVLSLARDAAGSDVPLDLDDRAAGRNVDSSATADVILKVNLDVAVVQAEVPDKQQLSDIRLDRRFAACSITLGEAR